MIKTFVVWTVLLFFGVFSAHASDDFYTTFNVKYDFNAKGESTVEQHISLINNFSHIYPVSYQVILKGETPTNIHARNARGPLFVTAQKTVDGTQITIQLKDATVGKGNATQFILTYTGSKAVEHGQVWEITLPKFSNSDFADEYTLSLSTPESFGHPAYIFPIPDRTDGRLFTFSKSKIENSGVTAAFGNFQTFSFVISYTLDRSSSIVIPSDTDLQKIYYSSIQPPPKQVVVDQDGNWIATFKKDPSKKLDIRITGQVNIQAVPKKTQLSDSAVLDYLKPQKFWESQDPKIVNLARKLKTPEQIYDYVVSNLKYDIARVTQSPNRRGALRALADPASAICTDFTDLFIALCRAAGIPARELNGFAYTTNPNIYPASLGDNILHAWPQYWDSKNQSWISVDPTWEMSKLDLNHFAFVIHGLSSQTPVLTTKSISANFTSFQKPPDSSLEITWIKPNQIWPFVFSKSTISLRNPGPTAVYAVPVSIKTFRINHTPASEITINVIPPFGQVDIPISLSQPAFPNFSSKLLTISAGDTQVTYNIPTNLLFIWPLLISLVSSIIIIALAFLTSKAWSLHIQKLQKQHHLRR